MTVTEVSPQHAAALLYAALGWYVLPLHTPNIDGMCDCPGGARCVSPGKHPRTLHGLDDSSNDPDRVNRWWTMWPRANIAVDLARSGLVDVAPDSLEWFAEFTARGLPPTLQFASGGGEGHAHHLYRRSADCAVYRDTRTGEFDVMSAGYAVMPPSVHRTGRTYTWIELKHGQLIAPPLEYEPEWVRQMLGRRRLLPTPVPEVDSDAPPVELRGEALERWHGRVFDARPTGAVDRSHSLWRLSVFLLEAGCQPAFIEQLLAERDSALGWTKFVGRRDAMTRYRIIVGRAVAGRGPGPIRLKPKPASARTSLQNEFLTARQLSLLEDEDIVWFAHGRVGAGLITELDGKAKQAGKTTLILELVHAVVYGEEFLGEPTQYSPVVYLTEQSGPSFKRNLSRAGLLDREDVHVLLWNSTFGHKWETVVDEARRYARDVAAGILIVDTLAQFSGIRGDDENKSGSALQTMEPVQAATKDGLAVLLSRHDRKSGGDVGDSGRGSSAYVGAVDIVLHLQRLPGDQTGKERQRMLDGISRFEETPDKLLVEFMPGENGERSAFRVLGDPVRLRNESLRIDILASLPTTREDGPTFEELRKDLGMREIDVRRVLRELERERLVEGFDRPRRYRQVVSADVDS